MNVRPLRDRVRVKTKGESSGWIPGFEPAPLTGWCVTKRRKAAVRRTGACRRSDRGLDPPRIALAEKNRCIRPRAPNA